MVGFCIQDCSSFCFSSHSTLIRLHHQNPLGNVCISVNASQYLWLKEIGHLGTKDVKAESALDRYPDVVVLEIEQEQASSEFLLPLCVSQIKSAMRVTSLTIFLSHILFFSCFFHFIFCVVLKEEGSERTI